METETTKKQSEIEKEKLIELEEQFVKALGRTRQKIIKEQIRLKLLHEKEMEIVEQYIKWQEEKEKEENASNN